MNLAREHGINIKDKESACVKVTIRSGGLFSCTILFEFSHFKALFHCVADSVEITLVNGVGTSDFQFFIDEVRLLLSVVNLDVILRYGNVTIGVLSEFLIVHEKCMQELAVVFIFILKKFTNP